MALSFADIRTGFWTNWEEGPVFGLKITLENSYASFLSNFLAIFITWTASHLWSITCYITMQCRSSKGPRDALHHQNQALLRNSPSMGGTMWTFLKQFLAWRKTIHKAGRRTFPMITLAAVYVSAFTAAGILSSRVSQPGAEVVLYPGICGFPSYTLDTSLEALMKDNAFTREAVVYARTCFQDSSNGDGKEDRRCQQFSTPRIGGNPIVNRNADCPFPGKGVCLTPALQITTNIPSGDLGMNVPQSESMWLKRITTWSPLDMSNYVGDGWVDTPAVHDDRPFLPKELRKYFYIGEWRVNESFASDWIFSTRNLFMPEFVDPYKLTPLTAYENYQGNFTPVPDLKAAAADTTYLGLSSLVSYTKAVNDPLYKATKYYDETSSMGPGYHPDEVLTVLGVTEQYQLCVDDKTCGPVTGILDDNIWSGLALTENQFAVAYRMVRSSFLSNIFWVVNALESGALLSGDYRLSEQSYTTIGLPEDQWQIDSLNIHNITLALMQRTAVEWASHPHREVTPGSGIYTDAHIEDPSELTSLIPFNYTGAALSRLCSAQKVRSYRYSSFSVLGVGMILGIGGLVIFLNCTLSECIDMWRRRRGASLRAREKRREHLDTELLVLQQMALEARDIGPWRQREGKVPMPVDPNLIWSTRGDKLGRGVSELTLTPSVAGTSMWSQSQNSMKGYQQVKTEVYEQYSEINSPPMETHGPLSGSMGWAQNGAGWTQGREPYRPYGV